MNATIGIVTIDGKRFVRVDVPAAGATYVLNTEQARLLAEDWEDQWPEDSALVMLAAARAKGRVAS